MWTLVSGTILCVVLVSQAVDARAWFASKWKP
jgi:hypothetical protein